MKDTRGFWYGDYWGAVSIGYNQNLISNPPTSFKDLMKPEYKGKVAVNGSPLSSNSAVSVVIAASLANGGSLKDVGPGIDFFATLKKSGNYIPVGTTSATVASGQTPISLDWDYNNLAYVKEFPSARWKVNIPTDGVYGGHYAQAVNATAPHPWAARLWEEFIYSDQGQLLYLKGFAHPSRFNDLANRKKIPASLLSALPAPSLYAKAKFASLSQQTAAKAKIATDWPAKVG
jgi:putative spermidine/putrescine transport system substrate-binding protein